MIYINKDKTVKVLNLNLKIRNVWIQRQHTGSESGADRSRSVALEKGKSTNCVERRRGATGTPLSTLSVQSKIPMTPTIILACTWCTPRLKYSQMMNLYYWITEVELIACFFRHGNAFHYRFLIRKSIGLHWSFKQCMKTTQWKQKLFHFSVLLFSFLFAFGEFYVACVDISEKKVSILKYSIGA